MGLWQRLSSFASFLRATLPVESKVSTFCGIPVPIFFLAKYRGTVSEMRLGPLCFGSNPDSSRSAKHQEIESIIRADKKRAKKEVKILLLGNGNALNVS